VELVSGEVVEAANIVWAAGVEASPLTARLGAPTDRSGRVRVGPDLAVPGRPEVFVIGDACRSEGPDGRLVPGVSPAAMQAGRHVARTISIALDGGTHRPGFRYWDKGSMATIGRSAAVAKFGDLHLTGLVAWFGWLLIHLVFLIDFRNRVAVLWQWFYAYVTYRRGARIIIGGRHGNGPP
jgi:NADH dehydrogenase